MFFPRSGIALEDKTTLELFRELTFQSFDWIEDPVRIVKFKKQPYTNQRGLGGEPTQIMVIRCQYFVKLDI